MTKNGKEVNKKGENGYRRKISGSLYLLMEKRNENDKMNGEWQDRKDQPKMTSTRAKVKKMDVKTLMEAEDGREENGKTQALLEKRSEKKNQHKGGEE